MEHGGAGTNMASLSGMNRRGIFFTLLAIVIISIFIISLTFFSGVLTRETAQQRVESLDNFVHSIENDLPRHLFINGYRTIFILEKDITEGGGYPSGVDAVFQEAFFAGKIYGVQNSLLDGTTFSAIEERIKERGEKISANVSLTSPILTVDQNDPWHVRYVLSAKLNVSDFAGLAEWNRAITVEAKIPIESFADPVYLVSTNSLITNKMVKTPYSVFVSGSDVSNLSSHLDKSYYINSSSAPSFLNRLEGELSADVNGIESLVDLSDLTAQGIGVQSKSVVDYIYFNSGSNPASCNVVPAGMPSWFKLDYPYHTGVYQVSCVGG